MARKATHGFTLVEMLVAIAILALVVVLVSNMLDSVTKVTTVSTKRMESDAQERQLLDRMAVDFAQMVKRKDVSYYVKTAGTPQAGNDLIAFFSTIPGYYPSPSFQSPISLVAYRVNSGKRMERLGNGLVWNGVSVSPTLAPVAFLPLTIAATWPTAVNGSEDPNDPVVKNFEALGSQVFRFEYYYLLKPDPATGVARGFSNGALWATTDTFNVGDVAAIVVAIAVLDSASRSLLTNPQLATLTGPFLLREAGSWGSITSGQLLSQWQTALDGVTDMPRAAISGIRLYERYFYLSSPAS